MKSNTLLLIVILFFVLSGSKLGEWFANTRDLSCVDQDRICAMWQTIPNRNNPDCNMISGKAFSCTESDGSIRR